MKVYKSLQKRNSAIARTLRRDFPNELAKRLSNIKTKEAREGAATRAQAKESARVAGQSHTRDKRAGERVLMMLSARNPKWFELHSSSSSADNEEMQLLWLATWELV